MGETAFITVVDEWDKLCLRVQIHHGSDWLEEELRKFGAACRVGLDRDAPLPPGVFRANGMDNFAAQLVRHLCNLYADPDGQVDHSVYMAPPGVGELGSGFYRWQFSAGEPSGPPKFEVLYNWNRNHE